MQTSCPLFFLLKWVSAKTTSEGHWNRWGVKYIHAHTDIHTHHLRHTVWARIACEALLLGADASLIQCNRIVIINQKPLNEEKTDDENKMRLCFVSLQRHIRRTKLVKWSDIQSLLVVWEREDTGYEVKHRRRILAQKRCRGSNTPGMVNSWGGQENRRREEDKKMRRGVKELEKRTVKERNQQGYTIFYSNGYWIRILYAKI